MSGTAQCGNSTCTLSTSSVVAVNEPIQVLSESAARCLVDRLTANRGGLAGRIVARWLESGLVPIHIERVVQALSVVAPRGASSIAWNSRSHSPDLSGSKMLNAKQIERSERIPRIRNHAVPGRRRPC